MAAVILLFLASPGLADFAGHGGMVRGLAVSPDGSLILTASFDYSARLWDFGSQNELGALIGHTGPVNAVSFLPDGERALSAGDDGALIVWDVRSNNALYRFKGHTARVADVAVSPSGEVAATASWDGTVRVWDLTGQTEVNRLAVGTAVTAVAFAPDGVSIFAGDKNGRIGVWNASSGAVVHELAAHDMALTDMAVSPDGTRLLSAGIDETVRLWDIETREEMRTLRGHDGPVLGVAFSPDGRKALSAGRDGTVILWALDTGNAVRWIEAHDGPAWAVAFSHDGRFGLSAGSDETVRAWRLDTGNRVGLPARSGDTRKPWLESDHPGAKLFRACAACHALGRDEQSRSGPHLTGLFGRRAGSVPGYAYSPALSGADFVWNHETLTALFRDGPHLVVPGSKMPLQRIADEQDLDDLVAYLEIITAPASAENGPR